MKALFTFIFFTMPFFISAQQDSIKNTSAQQEGYKEWTKYKNSLRIGIGTQKTIYTEIGFTRLKYIFNDLGYASSAYYTSVEWIPTILPKKEKNIIGLKIGYEINARILALGLETKYLTDFKSNDLIITPKVGLGFIGAVNFFYGYNISLTGNPFKDLGNNQFSINVNIN